MLQQCGIRHHICYGTSNLTMDKDQFDIRSKTCSSALYPTDLYRKCLFDTSQSKVTMSSNRKQSQEGTYNTKILVLLSAIPSCIPLLKREANAVARIDNLEFLSDVVPRTITYREYKEKASARAAKKKARPLQPGQTTLDGKRPGSSHLPEQMVISDTPMEDAMPIPASEPVALKRPSNKAVNGAPPNNLIFQHYDPNSKSKRAVSSGDVEMS